MQCREFSEISEAYLSDELLVETNIQVLGHLEECPKCRERFTAARWLRQKVGSSIRNSREFQIDPRFAKRLSAELRETARHKPLMSKLVRPQISIPIFASVVIAAVLGFMYMRPSSIRNISTLPSAQPVVEGVAHLFAEVVMHHRTCAVAKLKIWEKAARSNAAEEANHTETILKPLRANFSSRIELLHSDDCLFEGKPFVHVILKDGEKVVSVFLAKPAVAAGDTTYISDSVLSNEQDGSWIAAFRTRSQQVFVVSDFAETENLNIALTLFNAWM